ncbi:MAG: hydrolase [Gammaproteobacteria bacterium HGW-Gammaproteobacteria-12]|nr:MAG: hydrolase [Gammaproteobacteria bacterium HGW-Gammaproteobacteria-12]
MLKRIAVADLRIGMYVQEFCGSWMDHPFWKSKFLLNSPQDLQRIQTSSIGELWIDVSKGLDVEAGARASSEAEAQQEVEARLMAAAERRRSPPVVAMDVELDRAAKICARSKQAIISMFSDARMGKALDFGQVESLVEDISDSILRHPSALISLARLKHADEYTYMHSVAVCALMIALARQLGLGDGAVREAGVAGLLHDVGKMAIDQQVLNKPGKLSDAEFLFARMGAVCDVYDAITSNRPYKPGWDPAESIRKMAEWKGHFDEGVFQAFVKTVGIYPVGALVRLESGRLAVVLEQNAKSLLVPKVKAFFLAKSKVQIPPVVIDLSKPTAQDRIVGRESAAAWGFENLDELWSGRPQQRVRQ